MAGMKWASMSQEMERKEGPWIEAGYHPEDSAAASILFRHWTQHNQAHTLPLHAEGVTPGILTEIPCHPDPSKNALGRLMSAVITGIIS